MAMAQQIHGAPPRAPFLRPFKRIMSLDDEVVDQMVCRRVITRNEIAEEMVGFTTPGAALSYLADSKSPAIDLILLDVNMPRMNGFEFLHAAREMGDERKLPPVFVMLTSPLSLAHRAEAQGLDMIKAYLEKPLNLSDLLQATALIHCPPA